MNLREQIRRIIKEEINDFDWVKSQGLNHSKWEENAEKFGGADVLARDIYNNDPLEFLNMFNNLDIVQSEKNENLILYRFEKGNNMMIYDKKNEIGYINYYVIWLFLKEGFGLNHAEIQELTKRWMYETYNLRGNTAELLALRYLPLMYETYNLRGNTTQLRH